MHPETQFLQSPIAYARALDELRRQMALAIFDGKTFIGSAFTAEFIDEVMWKKLQPHAPQLLITPLRAKALGVISPAGGASLDASALTLHKVKCLADPTLGSVKYEQSPLPTPAFAGDVLQLAKHAGVLPALIFTPNYRMDEAELAVDVASLKNHSAGEIIEGASAKLPIDGAENATIISFRSKHSTSVHLALKIGKWESEKAPLVRVHSSCVTGDILGSLRCDCGDQLHMAIAQMSKAGAGILLYLHQEGRGIGISNKLRAYCLQEQGIDTYAANEMLGYGEDERDFGIAAAILRKLGATTISLLTNNPAKISLLERLGIVVSKRVPLVIKSSPHNANYLEAKHKKAGHLLD